MKAVNANRKQLFRPILAWAGQCGVAPGNSHVLSRNSSKLGNDICVVVASFPDSTPQLCIALCIKSWGVESGSEAM